MAPTVVLITGANRGIGKGLLELYLAKPNHTVIAANRNPDHPSSKALADLPTAEGTTLRVIKIDATSAIDSVNAAKELTSQGIDHIDILIANAGIALSWPKVSEVTIEEIQKHVDTNAYGFIRLYQAFLSLLKASHDPKLVTIGSSSAFLTVMQHWYTKAISVEEPWLTAFPIDPGWTQTDLGNRGAESFGVEKAALTIEESVRGVLGVIDASTRETHSGKLWKYDGNQEPW
ncbi:carbonyl reductase sniffer-like classical c SDR [Aspergillus parasiticus SU-1]|uniref:Carbonyl reductase sniffer-like classical c SDR n=1 Tax=Aspergillus parasiticus (strain ATCC 56775 / NRRL 5862 / SRRC 143 / SU-1) TaxID=1403190 RepID=A0A0F0IHX0_ASPPU|nr:carbonyl reductase sniffer-like classical c SDR [Aspergillus parasiticus SU-1]